MGGREADPAGSLSALVPRTGIWKSFRAAVLGERSGTGRRGKNSDGVLPYRMGEGITQDSSAHLCSADPSGKFP